MNENKEKIIRFIKAAGLGLIEEIPGGSTFTKILDEFSDQEAEIILTRINKLEKNINKSRKQTKKYAQELIALTKSGSINKDNNINQILNLESNRNKIIIQSQKYLQENSIIEKCFYNRNKQYLSNTIRNEILCGNSYNISADLWDSFCKSGLLNDDKISQTLAYLLYSDFYHTLSDYSSAEKWFDKAEAEAQKQNIDLDELTMDLKISRGHLLYHLNDLRGAKTYFENQLKKFNNHTLHRARALFRSGELVIFSGNYTDAYNRFQDSVEICNQFLESDSSKTAYHINADNYRMLGVISRLLKDYKKSEFFLEKSKNIYDEFGFRGLLYLNAEFGELYRAQNKLKKSLKLFNQVMVDAQRKCDINWFAHACLGECEILRIKKKATSKNYLKPLEIYRQINSQWGLANGYLSQAIMHLDKGHPSKALKLTNKSKYICVKYNLVTTLQYITDYENTGNLPPLPLTFF